MCRPARIRASEHSRPARSSHIECTAPTRYARRRRSWWTRTTHRAEAWTNASAARDVRVWAAIDAVTPAALQRSWAVGQFRQLAHWTRQVQPADWMPCVVLCRTEQVPASSCRSCYRKRRVLSQLCETRPRRATAVASGREESASTGLNQWGIGSTRQTAPHSAHRRSRPPFGSSLTSCAGDQSHVGHRSGRGDCSSFMTILHRGAKSDLPDLEETGQVWRRTAAWNTGNATGAHASWPADRMPCVPTCQREHQRDGCLRVVSRTGEFSRKNSGCTFWRGVGPMFGRSPTPARNQPFVPASGSGPTLKDGAMCVPRRYR